MFNSQETQVLVTGGTGGIPDAASRTHLKRLYRTRPGFDSPLSFSDICSGSFR